MFHHGNVFPLRTAVRSFLRVLFIYMYYWNAHDIRQKTHQRRKLGDRIKLSGVDLETVTAVHPAGPAGPNQEKREENRDGSSANQSSDGD